MSDANTPGSADPLPSHEPKTILTGVVEGIFGTRRR
jgi:hypothetical protein